MNNLRSHEHLGYGFFPGGDPRRFEPDGCFEHASNSPKVGCLECDERQRWKADCKKADAANTVTAAAINAEPACKRGPGWSIISGGYGLGVYTYECDDPTCDGGP